MWGPWVRALGPDEAWCVAWGGATDWPEGVNARMDTETLLRRALRSLPPCTSERIPASLAQVASPGAAAPEARAGVGPDRDEAFTKEAFGRWLCAWRRRPGSPREEYERQLRHASEARASGPDLDLGEAGEETA